MDDGPMNSSVPIKERERGQEATKATRSDLQHENPKVVEEGKSVDNTKNRDVVGKHGKGLKTGKIKIQDGDLKRSSPGEAREAKKRARSNREMENRILSKKLAEQVQYEMIRC